MTALQTAVQCASEADFTEQVLKYKTLSEAQRFLMQFENMVMQYHDNFQSRVAANKKYRHMVQNARMYISHFIQVLNMSVIRGEIKREQKELYGLDPNNHIVPDLSSEEDLLVWGENIINGEQKRTQMGGFPIYNPAINKVKVHYDIFKEHQINHTMHKKTTTRVASDMEEMRKKADALILEICGRLLQRPAAIRPLVPLQELRTYLLLSSDGETFVAGNRQTVEARAGDTAHYPMVSRGVITPSSGWSRHVCGRLWCFSWKS